MKGIYTAGPVSSWRYWSGKRAKGKVKEAVEREREKEKEKREARSQQRVHIKVSHYQHYSRFRARAASSKGHNFRQRPLFPSHAISRTSMKSSTSEL